MAKSIKMTIPLKGISQGKRKTEFEADGFVGEGCRAATELFTRALGSATDEKLKAEFYETPPEQHETINQ